MTRALVTGASGFLGRRLVARLRQDGVDVVACARATGFDVLRSPVPVEGCDVVYHLAGRTFVEDAWREAADFHLVNAHGTVRVLEACAREKTPIVYASAYIYGAPQRLPINESHPALLNNPYGFSKFMGEEACRFFSDAYGVPATILRLFNVYGPGQAGHFLVPTILGQVQDDSAGEIVVADLRPRRDYVYVDDVVDALIAATGAPGLYNVGSGASVSVRDIIVAALAAAGREKPFRDRGQRRRSEIDDVVADITALSKATGWRPKTALIDGLKATIVAQ